MMIQSLGMHCQVWSLSMAWGVNYRSFTSNIWQILVELSMLNRELLLLVGGFNPSEKYSSIGMIIPNIWEHKTCSKPPTRKVLCVKRNQHHGAYMAMVCYGYF